MYKVALIALLHLIAIFQTAMSTAETESGFYQAVHEIGESDNIVGLAMAVVREGEVESIKTFGVREFGAPQKIDAQTTFRIASLSKAFAATVVAELADEGKLAFDNPISRFNLCLLTHTTTYLRLA